MLSLDGFLHGLADSQTTILIVFPFVEVYAFQRGKRLGAGGEEEKNQQSTKPVDHEVVLEGYKTRRQK